VVMADIGKEEREIEVVPLTEPVPAMPAVPQEPAVEPVTVPAPSTPERELEPA
jgi:hypothetical protein